MKNTYRLSTRRTALLLALSLLLCLSSCGGRNGEATDTTVVTGTQNVPGKSSSSQKDTVSSETDPEGKTSVKAPKMLRCVEYYVGSGNDYLSSYSEYIYDEQGNCTECEEYKRNDDEWVHFRHTEFTYDGQGRIQEKRSHTFSDLGDVDDTMTQIESAPDYVALNFGTSGSREVYYYNDMGQCVREEFDGGDSCPYWYKTYAYDGEGKITEANLYYPSEGTREEYTLYSYFKYEYEGDAVSLLDIIHPSEAQPEPANPEPAEADPVALLAACAGNYTPYPIYDYYSGGRSITLNADGVVTGGETDGQTPTSIVQNSDGSITIWFGSSDRYTLFPVGCSGTPAGTGYDSGRVNLEYLYTGGGAMNIIYYADPIS